MTKIIEGARDGDLTEIQFDHHRFGGNGKPQCRQRRTEYPFAYYPDTGPLRKADRA